MSKLTLGIVSDWINGKGIMSVLTDNFDVPWADSIDGQTLDDDYYGNRSGNKIIAPLVQKFVNEDGITDDKMLRLARVIYAKYGNNWQKSYDALIEEYNPIWNVDGTETITVDAGKRKKTFTKGRQQNDETYGQHSETFNKNGVTDTISDKAHTDDIVQGARKKTTKSQIEGFNSSDFSDANKEIVDDDQVTDQNKYGLHETENIQGERINEYGQQVNNIVDGQRIDFDEDDAYKDTTTNVRQGNIGVTSTQNLLTQEMEFRLAYSLMDSIVFPDVDKVMCLNIFGCEDLTMNDFTIITDYVLPVASATLLGGVKIGNGITIAGDGTISVDTSDYITQEQLTEAIQNFITQDDLNTVLASYVTGTALAETLSGYATTTALATKQDTLVSGNNIKTINGESILGSGDITIKGGTVTISMNSNLGNQTGTSSNISMEVIQ